MKTLSPECRKQLERTVIQARDVAEAGARVALEALAVHHHEPYGHMTSEQRTLRRRLRAHARQLGDRLDARTGSQGIQHLVHECAYEHWHGMLFARFLAENHLLIEPEMGVAISLEECEELAKEENADKWTLAARFAHRMLPQVFRPDHPVFEVQFAREHRLKLEGLVESLPADVYTATDALGWVYQFWQTKKKDEVNRSEVKIGADELPVVTQLFTEPYMVQFLLHNSLGAWWVSRYPDKPCPVELTYLRKTDEGSPAAGSFDGWPDELSGFRLLDPCCGSGHFLVAAFLMLVPMRVALEGLSAVDAVDAVLRDNLHGLELDQRCVAIAAFALALEAWRYPEAGGYRPLPRFNLAWCGQPVAGQREQWLALAEGDSRLEAGMAALYDTFHDAPLLGSLIDPTRLVLEDLLTAGFADLEPLLERALRDHAGEEEWEETAIAARGLADAAQLLSGKYDLVVTNVPYLVRSKQGETLQRFCETHFPLSKNELATVFLERCIAFCSGGGNTGIVIPQNWLALTSYRALREKLLRNETWLFVARLGFAAFRVMDWWAFNTALVMINHHSPDPNSVIVGCDLGERSSIEEKSDRLIKSELKISPQALQLRNPDARVVLETLGDQTLLQDYARSLQGISPADALHYSRKFWEVQLGEQWYFWQGTVDQTIQYGGRDSVLWWNEELVQAIELGSAYVRGGDAWGRRGVAVRQMRHLPCTLYTGERFDTNCAVIVPNDTNDLFPIWCYCASDEFNEQVRKMDQKVNVTNATLAKVPFDSNYWRQVALEKYPKGLPQPYTNDPTQWIFHGHPCGSVAWDKALKQLVHGQPRIDTTVLQVAIARLLGYRWPAENDSDMEFSNEARAWVEKAKALYPFEDRDGVVCLPSIRGERPAHERLLHFLQAAWGDTWRDSMLAKLLADSDASGLDDWLRNHFFEQHCKLFHHRPFIWHLWDGRKRDGFHALINYHKLAEGNGKGRRLLESLTYSYLGDWITRQQDGVKRGEGGAEDRLAAALELQKRLVAIIEGEPPFDIFVRWKPIDKQPIGWEPDINDGVRLNIRPFMAQDIPGGKKGAGILRTKPNIHWKKDRGKESVRESAQFPWFWNDGKFTGERINDVYLTIAEKRAAREQAEVNQ